MHGTHSPLSVDTLEGVQCFLIALHRGSHSPLCSYPQRDGNWHIKGGKKPHNSIDFNFSTILKHNILAICLSQLDRQTDGQIW